MTKENVERIRFDFPFDYARALKARAGYDGVHPRDVILAALDTYLQHELKVVRERSGASGPQTADEQPQKKKRRAKE